MGETRNRAFQLPFNACLKVDFHDFRAWPIHPLRRTRHPAVPATSFHIQPERKRETRIKIAKASLAARASLMIDRPMPHPSGGSSGQSSSSQPTLLGLEILRLTRSAVAP